MDVVRRACSSCHGQSICRLTRWLLQAFCDLEAYHSYEGTYEVNVLVAGRGATGISAIKAPAGKQKVLTAEGAQ